MISMLLSITHYDENGQQWYSEDIENPTWEQIEQSIRLLDRFQRPFLHLKKPEEPLESGYLSVLGGEGAYSLSAAVGDSFPNYFDPTQSDEEIDIWTSDQGYYPEEKYVCYDLNLVLRIAHHYAQFGELSPVVTWQ